MIHVSIIHLGTHLFVILYTAVVVVVLQLLYACVTAVPMYVLDMHVCTVPGYHIPVALNIYLNLHLFQHLFIHPHPPCTQPWN